MNASYPKRSLKPLVVGLTVALFSSAALAEWYEGYVPKQQESMAINVGSGYTGDEMVSQNAQSGSDVPLAEDYVAQDSLALDAPYQMGSGYTSQDQSAAVIIIADSMTMEGEQNASSGAAE